jgi:ankyrin repeat protein
MTEHALNGAAAKNYEPFVELLLEREADVNHNSGRSCFPLQAAAEADHKNMVRLLLDKGAVINKVDLRDLFQCESRFVLQDAATCGREAVVQLLIDKGADVNLQGLRGSAISLAVKTTKTQLSVFFWLMVPGLVMLSSIPACSVDT